MKISKDGNIYTFNCEEGDGYFSQRNNELVWPSVEEKPNAQYRTSWKNMCNVTSYVNALYKAGFNLPVGKFKQPEDNLGYYILTSKAVMEKYAKECPAMYKSFLRCLDGQCSTKELENVYFPNELHDYLCFGANAWLGTNAAKFSTNINFKKALWRYMVEDNLPIVISTKFGGFGHIVCVTGVQYNKADYETGKAFRTTNKEEWPEITPVSIIVDDPWGKYSPKTNKYDAPFGGNDIIVPWDRVVSTVKPCNSETLKWAHTFNHSIATV